MIDLHNDHDRFGSTSDPDLSGHLHYPNDVDRSLNETVTDKIRKYRADYNNNPPNDTSFMSGIGGTVQLVYSTSGHFHFHCMVFCTQQKSKS